LGLTNDLSFDRGHYPVVLRVLPGFDYGNQKTCPDGSIDIMLQLTR